MEKLGIEKFVNEEKITYTRIFIVKAISNRYIDIFQNPQAIKDITEMLESKNNNGSPKVKVNFFAEMCGLVANRSIDYYSLDDISLGSYIIQKVNKLFTKCEMCKRPYYHHMAFYYFGDNYIRITAELTGISKALAINQDNAESYQYIDDYREDSFFLNANRLDSHFGNNTFMKMGSIGLFFN